MSEMVNRRAILINDQIRSFSLIGNRVAITYHDGHTNNEICVNNDTANDLFSAMKSTIDSIDLPCVYIGGELE